MIGKNHLATTVNAVIITDAGFKLISDTINRPDLFGTYRNYVTCGLVEDISFTKVIIMVGCVVFLFLGCLLPDIDSKKSMLGKFIYLPVKHRTFTHSIFFALPFVIGGFFLRPFLWLSYGMLIHLFFDGFSKAGICWFWPLSKYKYYENGAFVKKGHFLKLYNTGEWSEYFCVAITFFAALALTAKVYFALF